MADYANAFVKFKIKPIYKEAFETIFKRQKRNQSKYFEWFDYFSFITTDGKIKTTNPYGENEYLYFEGTMGLNTNLFDDFSIKDDLNGIDGDIVSLRMCRKWAPINDMVHIVQNNLGEIADEVLFCEIIGYDREDEQYYLVSYDVEVKKDEEFNEYGYAYLTEKKRTLIPCED